MLTLRPQRVLALFGPIEKTCGVLFPLLLLGGGAWGLFFSPPDYLQGESVRMMYIHVPAAWLALGIYTAMALCTLCGILFRNHMLELFSLAAAPCGALFALLTLITGSLWGKPTWGTFWVWDARLTSMLILFFLYLGYLALVHAFSDPMRGLRQASILLLLGAINVPIIKFSVDWWNTLHQPASLLRSQGVAIDSQMLLPLLVVTLAFGTYFLHTFGMRLRALLAQRRLQNLIATKSIP